MLVPSIATKEKKIKESMHEKSSQEKLTFRSMSNEKINICIPLGFESRS
jgi:hypothetical protein